LTQIGYDEPPYETCRSEVISFENYCEKGKEKERKIFIGLYSAFKYARILTKRSGMDHIVLGISASNTMPAFPS